LVAERMLAHVLGVGRLELYLQFDRPLRDEELNSFRELTRRRTAGEPLQYLLGHTDFRELTLQVGPGVLIPRPETEQLVSLALERLDGLRAGRHCFLRVLDLCAGSGAIGLSLACERGGLWCLMSELTGPATAWAQRNLRQCSARLQSPVALLRCDLLSALRPDRSFDLIVANPPYVKYGDIPKLRPQVREHEPAEALSSGPDGIDIISRIIAEAADYLRPGGVLVIEIGETMRENIQRLFDDQIYRYHQPEFHLDLAGKLRFVTAGVK